MRNFLGVLATPWINLSEEVKFCNSIHIVKHKLYGSLYVTLCFVLWRFDFGVLTFYFHILSFLFCVLCTMLFILNGAIHDLQTRYGRKDGRKRSCKDFNAFIVHVMLVFFFTFEIHAAGNYHKVKNIQVMLQSGFTL